MESFDGIKDEWNSLLIRSDYDIPFLRHEWLTTWWAHFGSNHNLAIILVRKNNQLIAAVPLMEKRRYFFGFSLVTLSSLTNHHSSLYHFIVEKGQEDSVGLIWDYLKSRKKTWDILQLEELPAHVDYYEVLLEKAKRDDYTAEIWNRGTSAYVAIDGDWCVYWKSLKTKFRSNIRNRSNRLTKIGDIQHEVIREPDKLIPALNRGFEIEQKSWKGANQSAIACSSVLTSFYSEIAKIAFEENWLQLSFLKVGDAYVAFDYSLIYNSKLYCLKIGYDPEFRPYSVGQLLCKAILEDCFEKKHAEYDFLGEVTTQKRDWTDSSHKIVWLFVYNKTLLGKLSYLFKFVLVKQLKMLRAKISAST